LDGLKKPLSAKTGIHGWRDYEEEGEDASKMLVIVKNENKAFSLSGNVSANFSGSTSNSNNASNPGGTVTKTVTDTLGSISSSVTGPTTTLTKTTSDTLSSSGGIFPSYSKSWTDQKFEVWFFLVE